VGAGLSCLVYRGANPVPVPGWVSYSGIWGAISEGCRAPRACFKILTVSVLGGILMKRIILSLAVLGCLQTACFADTITVASTSDIFLAGLTTIPTLTGGAGDLPPAINVSAGETISLSASGQISCDSGCGSNGPDGLPIIRGYTGIFNVGNYNGPDFALTGVFGGSSLTTPWSVFFVGSSAILTVPVGATQLYLGIPDGDNSGNVGDYSDNLGSLQVDFTISAAVPEPSTWAMMLLGFLGLGLMARRRALILAA
jgi:PEP-CTERM motif